MGSINRAAIVCVIIGLFLCTARAVDPRMFGTIVSLKEDTATIATKGGPVDIEFSGAKAKNMVVYLAEGMNVMLTTDDPAARPVVAKSIVRTKGPLSWPN